MVRPPKLWGVALAEYGVPRYPKNRVFLLKHGKLVLGAVSLGETAPSPQTGGGSNEAFGPVLPVASAATIFAEKCSHIGISNFQSR